jgi:hypothetical protein
VNLSVNSMPSDLIAETNRLRRGGGKYFTNFFGTLEQPLDRGCVFERSVLWLAREDGFRRLHFAGNSVEALAADLKFFLSGNPAAGPIVTDVTARELDPALEGALEGSGFEPYGTYRRLTAAAVQNPKIRQRTFATAADLPYLYEHLYRVFDKYSDHLPTAARLRELLESKQALVLRKNEGIVAYVIFHQSGERAHFNYLYCDSESPLSLVALLRMFYSELTDRGIRTCFAWVRDDRASLIAMHRHFGLLTDGLKDFIFVRR